MAKTTIHSDYIPDNAITSTKIAENSIGAREIATNAITTLYVADGSVTTVKIADDAITSAKLDTNIDIAGTLGVTGNITGTLATAAQTNITSVGTLTSITSSGSNDINGTDDLRLRFLNGGSFKAGIQVPTTSGDMISGSAVDDLAIRSQANILFSTGGNVEKMRMDSSGRVAIGTSSILTDTRFALHEGNVDLEFSLDNAVADTARIFAFDRGTTTHKNLQLRANQTEFYSGSSEAMRIDSSGNVGIGVTPTDYFSGGDNLVVGTGTGEGGITLASSGTNQWNYILFADGTSGDAQYRGQVAYNHSTDQLALTASGYVTILTGSGRSEKMRIDSSGAVGIGQVPETARFSGHDILQVGGRATFLGNDTVSATGQTVLLDNLYYDASGNFQHRGDSRGVAMQFVEGQVIFSNSNQTTGTPTVSERMRIDSSGNVGIGLANPSDYYADNLVVSSASEKGITIASTGTSNANYLMFADGTTGDQRYRGYIGYNHSADNMAFAAAGTERMRIDGDGSIHVTGSSPSGIYLDNNNVRIYHGTNRLLEGSTDSTAVVSLAEGFTGYLYCEPTIRAKRGISFGTDTATANQLDDYEEGTWTPVYDGSTSASGVAYTTRSGSYTKIGNTVTASCYMVLSNKGTVVGVSRISGLPFAGNNSPAFHVIAPMFGNLDLDVNQQGTGAQYGVNSFVYLFITENDTALVQMTNGHVNNNTEFHFTVTYMTNA